MDLLQSFVHYVLTPIQRFQPKVAAQEELPNCCSIYDRELVDDRKTAAAPDHVDEVRKKKVHFETASLVDDQTGNRDVEKGVMSGKGKGVRVKILMRKEEAVRMLSKCKDGGVLEMKDVAEELRLLLQIPGNRVCVFESSTHNKDV